MRFDRREPRDEARHPSLARLDVDEIVARARDVLEANWTGTSTAPSRTLYPHQWSWDSAFVAVGRTWYDEGRARVEMQTLFEGGWLNGKLPHIICNPAVPEEAYFPGPSFWQSQRSAKAPRTVQTSGLTQPPIHARVALEMHRRARDLDASKAFLRWLYPRLVAEHAYLESERDPWQIGLPSIVHPWESGLDNSPVWDEILKSIRIPPGGLPPYQRRDIVFARPEDRPTDDAYDAFIYLASQYRDADYDDGRFAEAASFLVAGPLFVAIYLWSTHALAEIARLIGHDPRPHEEAAAQIHAALLNRLWDPVAGRFAVFDVVANTFVPEETIVSLAPLLDPDLSASTVNLLVAELESACFHPSSGVHFVVPSTSLESPAFDRRRYWRGPVWLNTNWLLEAGLRQHGRSDLADEIVASSLALVARSGFHEYFDPLSGSAHGSPDFSWSAALAIDFARRARRRQREQASEMATAPIEAP